MEQARYQSRVEEARTIKRRTRQGQVRLMLLFKEAEQDGCLDQFCADTDYTHVTAKNYLSAYEHFVEMRVLPETIDSADLSVSLIVEEMWEDVFDATLHDPRYGKVDRDGIATAAVEAGLQGPSKAMDIAKNTKSMKVAIVGDRRVTEAAMEALFLLVEKDSDVRQAMQDRMLDVWLAPTKGRGSSEDLDDDEKAEKLLDFMRAKARALSELSLSDVVSDFTALRIREIQDLLTNTIIVLEGRRALRAL